MTTAKAKTTKVTTAAPKTTTVPAAKPSVAPSANVGFVLDPKIQKLLKKISETLKQAELDSSALEIEQLTNDVAKNRFTVSVVGEFSKGKSTFINKMFNRELLPVANSPTTAMLTRIRYNPTDMLVISDLAGKNQESLPLNVEAWNGYTADIDGNEPSGVAFVGLPDLWLKKGIEIIDTPGAGDLEAKRTAVIGDALRGSDGAIITISAEQALSMSEKLFIEERLISKKVPYIMLIITKLDRIPANQRAGIIEFVKTKLEMWKFNIPVYIPYVVDIPGDKNYSHMMGMDKIKNTIDSWTADPKRTALTLQWVSLKVISIIQSAMNTLNEQLLLSSAGEDEKKALIQKKKELISNAEIEWENLKIKMMEKSSSCCEQMNAKVADLTTNIVERLQFEISHSSNPQKWWNQDFPYKMKLELTNMSTAIENMVSSRIAEDARWFNSTLEKNFHTNILISQRFAIDKHEYSNLSVDSSVKVEDLSKKKVATRIGLSALSVVCYLACSAVGIPPIIATIGVGTGGGVVSEGVFKKKTDSQIDALKIAIQDNVPGIIKNAMKNSEVRVKNMYNDIITEATKQEKKWLDTQTNAIKASSSESAPSGDSKKINTIILNLQEQCTEFDKFLINK